MAQQANEEEKKQTAAAEEKAEKKETDKPTNGPTAQQAEADNKDQEKDETNKKTASADPNELLKKNKEQTAVIEKLTKEKQDLNNRFLRSQADFDNFRKRTVKEKADARKYRAQDIVTDMLEIVDNFQRALAVKVASEDGKNLKKGMEMVLAKLQSALQKEGVEEIESLGKPFDPTLHQAVMQEESSKYQSGTVTEVLQPGYKLNGRVIRPAMVKVSA